MFNVYHIWSILPFDENIVLKHTQKADFLLGFFI